MALPPIIALAMRFSEHNIRKNQVCLYSALILFVLSFPGLKNKE